MSDYAAHMKRPRQLTHLLLMTALACPVALCAAEDPLVGTWRSDAGEVVALQDNGTAVVGGAQVRWRAAAGQLIFTSAEGEAALPYRLAGDRIMVQTEEGISSYQRVAQAAPVGSVITPAVAATTTEPLTIAALSGVWLGPEGASVVRPDGTGKTQGKEFTWAIDGGMLAFSQDGQSVQMPARLVGGKLILGNGPEVEMVRAIGAAGWWNGWDGSVDPTMIISITHHVALLPDGTVSYAKGELGAARANGWFSTRREGTATRVVGHWEQQGEVVHFTLGSGSYDARYDPERQALTVRGMGQVNEGSDIVFARE